MGYIPKWFDGYKGVDEKIAIYKSIRCGIEFEFRFPRTLAIVSFPTPENLLRRSTQDCGENSS